MRRRVVEDVAGPLGLGLGNPPYRLARGFTADSCDGLLELRSSSVILISIMGVVIGLEAMIGVCSIRRGQI
jgi:hypothetical protein